MYGCVHRMSFSGNSSSVPHLRWDSARLFRANPRFEIRSSAWVFELFMLQPD
jgi:hypothetical protein